MEISCSLGEPMLGMLHCASVVVARFETADAPPATVLIIPPVLVEPPALVAPPDVFAVPASERKSMGRLVQPLSNAVVIRACQGFTVRCFIFYWYPVGYCLSTCLNCH